MLRLENITVWDTGEKITLIIPENRQNFFSQEHAITSGSVDASGLIVAPGLCDPHVHFRDPGQTDKETMISGAKAAAAGGYTNVLIMPNTIPALDGQDIVDLEQTEEAQFIAHSGCKNSIEYLQQYEKIHDQKLPVEYALSVCASVNRKGEQASDITKWQSYIVGKCCNNHPITAISDDGSAVTDSILQEVAQHCLQTGLPLVEHCEHHDTGVMNDGQTARKLQVPGIPASTELQIVERDIKLAEETGVQIHFQHVSTAAAFDAIRQAKKRGLPITCETAPHYIALCDEDVQQYGTYAKMNPPLRSKQDMQATIAAIADGTVDMIATDHAPHTIREKETSLLEAPNGIIGLETAYAVCNSVLVQGGYISQKRLIELMSCAPARFMNHKPTDIAALLNTCSTCATQRELNLSQVENPQLVNLCIINPELRWSIDAEQFWSKARNTPFNTWNVSGKPLATIIQSQLTYSAIPQNRSVNNG
ncbi:MAG: dihydroorotase [Bifidobacteriaceae bacterium]|nr:dihydroorotase [Bifidobacteriaceae bacterium]